MDSKKKTKNRKYASIIQAEEEHLAALSKETNTPRVPCSTNVQETKNLSENLIVSDITVRDTVLKQSYSIETKTGQTTNQVTITNESNNITSTNELTSNKKHKTKKCKKSSAESQNISVKSSFSKFDALQKQNLIHVRSSDGGKAKEKFTNATSEIQSNCRKCEKPVYKMEEIKAEKSIYHKNCFRCVECKKQLKVDTYQSHESNLYCIVHFKLLFAPKIINDDKADSHKKPELIIRENQPKELPPDVVRASSKPDLGLEELQQLNVKSRFQIFENGDDHREQKSKENENVKVEIGKRSSSIVSKLVKLKQSGCFMGEDTRIPETTSISNSENDDSDDASDSEDADADLVRSQKRTQRERPIGLGDAMLDIKSKFESGSLLTKEERREERKQEIQNIRSRLFMGKQAKIKEMYQQAVAESEQGIVSASRKPEIEIGCGASSLKEKYEKGTIFENNNTNKENCNKTPTGIADDVEVFDSGISKKSRSIFLELDANLAAERCSTKLLTKLPKNVSTTSNRLNSETEIEGHQGNIVKYDEKQDDIKIQTSEISQKFKFFESYRPAQSEKKKFSITPPREGVVKLPTPESDLELEKKPNSNIDNILEKSQTTSVMLSKFREMENKTNKQNTDVEPRPLKCFTPPPDGGERYYKDEGSDFDSDDDYDDDEEDEEQDDDIRSKYFENDAALKEAQLAARAKFLKAKFEKWEANEIEQSKNCGAEYPQEVCNDQSIESTKALRERFENFNKVENAKPIRSRHQVNRFV